MEKALVLIKPDGVEKAIIGKVVQKFEDAGLRVIAMKMVKPTQQMVEKHYTDDETWLVSVGTKTKKSYQEKGIEVNETEREIGVRIRSLLMNELSRSAIIAIVLEGNEANFVSRKIAGGTEPRKADPSSIRGMYSIDSYETADKEKRPVRNIVHVSETAKDAEKEIKVWFTDAEIYSNDK